MAAYTTIDDSEANHQIVNWTGDQSEKAITLAGDTDMQPDLVWVKGRSFSDTGGIFDSVRGATKLLIPNTEAAESTVAQSLKSFDSDGFTMGTESALNKSSNGMVAWCWKESVASGLDILTYTGNATARTIAHNLSVKPNFILVKKQSASGGSWFVYNTAAVPATHYIKLNETGAIGAGDLWNDVEPTSSVFSLGTSSDVNGDGITYVAYVFASIRGYSKFGSFIGNANADGTFVHCGFKPKTLLVKSTASGGGFYMMPTLTSWYNGDTYFNYPYSTTTESNSLFIDFHANGFKCRKNDDCNNAATYGFYCWAEAPLVNSNGVPCNAR